MALRYCLSRTIVPTTKDRFTNNLPDLSQLLCVAINKYELDEMTSNIGTIFSNTLEAVAPVKLKRLEINIPHHVTTVIPILSRKKLVILSTNGEKLIRKFLELCGKNSMSSYRQHIKAARAKHICKLIENNQNNPRFLFSTVARLTRFKIQKTLSSINQ